MRDNIHWTMTEKRCVDHVIEKISLQNLVQALNVKVFGPIYDQNF